MTHGSSSEFSIETSTRPTSDVERQKILTKPGFKCPAFNLLVKPDKILTFIINDYRGFGLQGEEYPPATKKRFYITFKFGDMLLK